MCEIRNFWSITRFIRSVRKINILSILHSYKKNCITFCQDNTEWRKKNVCFWICLRFLSLRLPQIKSLRSKTSYSRRSESFHSRRNCNCATRNVSKCDAELWREAPDVCTAKRAPSFRYSFRNWVINVSNQNCIYYGLFLC